MAVAVVVEAIASHRPYRPALGVGVAAEEIRKHRGTFYDPEVVDACLEIIEKETFDFEI
jgi:HD-GYP domain-containing protein (c-di-GMP phosphodiesterase class II)